jgi:exonuclease SbcC
MTSGRYELIIKKLSTDLRRKTGLDIEVYDYYTSKARDVNTLSGGEGFKAALALALGLADVAHAYSGGIKVDAMFIDEGFDSLSQESLDQAIDCLLDINEKGRVVGIISHVAELKERIDTRLIVEKGKNGSKTHFEGV